MRARVGIVGAGASGLVAAAELMARGHAVTLWEASDRVGGKCRSVEVEGRAYEMAATVGILPLYEEVFALSRRLGLPDRALESVAQHDLGTGRPHRTPPAALLRAGWQGARFAWATRALRGPSHPPALDGAEWRVPWSAYVKERGLVDFDDRAAALLVALGYSDGAVPAGYVGRFFLPMHLWSTATGTFRIWPLGTSRIWERLAAELVAGGLDLRLGQRVRAVRPGPPVGVELADGHASVDALLVTAPGAVPVPGFEAAQAALRWHDYRSYLVRAEGLPDADRVGIHIVKDNLRPERAGRPVCWVHPHPETALSVVFAWGRPDLDDAAIYANIVEDLGRLGGGVRELVRSARWAHFTHTAADAEGHHARLAAQQGRGGVWLGGEAGAVAMVATVVSHARATAAAIAAGLSARGATPR